MNSFQELIYQLVLNEFSDSIGENPSERNVPVIKHFVVNEQ
jgi:hypothetical protein